MIRHAQCPVCHSTHILPALNAGDHTVSGETFEIWQCAGCSVRFTQGIPEEHAIGKYYRSEAYISHSESGAGLINQAYLLARRFTLRQKRRLVERENGGRRGTLLDYGAGTGAFLHELHRAGWKTVGLEPDELARQRALERYQVLLDEPAELAAMAEHSVDMVTLWHVLEHVHRLHETLSELRRVSRRGGKMLVAVPNYTSADAEHYGGYWAAYDVPRHLYHFSPAAMGFIAKQHGLVLEKVLPMWLDSFYVSLLSEKYRGRAGGYLRGLWWGLRSSGKALRNPRRASSLIYVLSVPAG